MVYLLPEYSGCNREGIMFEAMGGRRLRPRRGARQDEEAQRGSWRPQ